MLKELELAFKALGEPTRLQIIKLLSRQELCVCEVQAILNISQPRVSQHVKVLKQAGIVTERRERQKRFLSLNKDYLEGRVPLFSSFMKADLDNLEEMAEIRERLLIVGEMAEVKACKENC